jgi:hypothetical protein
LSGSSGGGWDRCSRAGKFVSGQAYHPADEETLGGCRGGTADSSRPGRRFRFNTRKDLADGRFESTIEDLARSIDQQGLLQPIMVYRRPDGRYALVALSMPLVAFRCKGFRGSGLRL